MFYILLAFLRLKDVLKRGLAIPFVEEEVSELCIHSIREMNAIPADILARVLARGRAGGSADPVHVKVIAAAAVVRSATGLEGLLEVVALVVGQNGLVGAVGVHIGDDAVGVLVSEVLQLLLEEGVVGDDHRVGLSRAPRFVAV